MHSSNPESRRQPDLLRPRFACADSLDSGRGTKQACSVNLPPIERSNVCTRCRAYWLATAGIVDANGQALVYVYSRDNEAEALQAKVLTKGEARRIAVSVAGLPQMLGNAD
jgi:hypothetical protein